ncbi:trypsin-like peptidase domain-containing protein [Luteimonas sp. RD2P54]|uniref:Trypsin-like peptidase domain-containing protein n=1 Tax=Luteimonas endophytica TaxID=3042023 RepID=A0ABT6J9H4_9GAMM|nr:trypsin-like peptidase domain-containing protein [Luteimonas endophytica]MDH5823456.1 trypsin-like peptidase domain-containing protein [Luteimonas endophytica]
MEVRHHIRIAGRARAPRPVGTVVRLLGRSILVGALALAPFAAPALAGEKPLRLPGGDVVKIDAADVAQQRPKAGAHPFATREQRAAVRPMRWSGAESAPPRAQAAPARVPAGPAGAADGGGAPPFAEYLARSHFPDAWEALDAAAKAAGEPAAEPAGEKDGAHHPYVRFPGNYYTSRWQLAPWNKIGKLYFTTPSGGSSYCTANVASGNSVIITAAHCVYTRGQGFNSNFVFVPADRYGVAPYGSFGWSSASVMGNWINQGGRRWDVAVVKLAGEASTGVPVTSYVGWLGRSWNQPYSEFHYSIGYASNFSTQYTTVCAGQTYSSPAEGDNVLVQGCDMTYGSSGGGWLRQFAHDSHGGNYVNAVVSGPHIGDFGQSYVGPRFASDNIVPLCNAIGC